MRLARTLQRAAASLQGLLYYDGIDSVGRPIVVVNARADAMLQPKLRNRAMEYMKRRLEPIVYQVCCQLTANSPMDKPNNAIQTIGRCLNATAG